MRTEAELRAALEAFRWYVNGPDGKGDGRVLLQERDTVMNVVGVLAGLEWVLGVDRPDSPVGGTLQDIAVMRQGPGRN